MADEPARSAVTTLTHRALVAPGFLPASDTAGAPPSASEVTSNASETAAATQPGAEAALAEPTPAGEALADLLADGLGRCGWAVAYRWTTYAGHALDARRGEHRYDVEVALLDAPGEEGAGRWLVTAKRRTGFFKGLLKGGQDPAEHELLRRDIDLTLAADARCAGTQAVWVAEKDWGG